MTRDPKIDLIRRMLCIAFGTISNMMEDVYGLRKLSRDEQIHMMYIEYLKTVFDISQQDAKDIEELFRNDMMSTLPSIAARITIDYLLTTDYFTV